MTAHPELSTTRNSASSRAITTPHFGFEGSDATYFLGRETVLLRRTSGAGRVLDSLFAFMMRNATSAAHHFELPPERVIELGTQVSL